MLVQMMKSTECNIAAVTVGDDELSILRMFGIRPVKAALRSA